MKKIISTIPAPLAGLALGLAGLGSITARFHSLAGSFFTIIAALLLAVYLVKIVFHFPAFSLDLQHPVFSSILPTFSMALMIVSAFLAKHNFIFARTLWYSAIIIHILLLFNFLYQILKKRNFRDIVPSYFIPTVGIVTACVSGKVFNSPALCYSLFIFGFVSYLISLPIIIFRLRKEKLPQPKEATIAIMAAPASLCLAGFLSLTGTTTVNFLYLLVPLSIIMTLFVYYKLIGLLKSPFNVGFSAFTFPLVISAISMYKFTAFLNKAGNSWNVYFERLALVELLIAVIVVLYVSIRYFNFYLVSQKQRS